MRTELYQKEETLLLNAFLKRQIFDARYKMEYLLEHPEELEYIMGDTGGIELIVRPECNQKCEYCYIARYGDTLYPKEERVSNDVILHNLDLLLTYVFEDQQLYIPHWE